MRPARPYTGAPGRNDAATPAVPRAVDSLRHGSAPVPNDAAPAVLYASDTLVAVDKPAGIIVHGDGTGALTLTGWLHDAIAAGQVDGVPARDAADLQALQRLDRDTSGIVLFSHCKGTQGAYDRLIAERRVEKRYRAIACGKIPWDERTFEWPLGRDRHDARRMRVSRTGKDAQTQVRVRARKRIAGQWLTLVDVLLGTGRKHQIRVHLAHAGFPLLGDALYGTPDPRGLMLHAYRMAFEDPISDEAVRITAPVPGRVRELFPDAR